MEVGSGGWKSQLGLVSVAWDKGDTELALERARTALEWAPEEPLVRLVYGKLLMIGPSPAEAEEHLRFAVERAPTLHEAPLRLSQLFLFLERAQDAYDLLDRVARENPDVAEYWLWLGDFLYELGEHEAVVGVLGTAIERHQKNAEIYQRLGQSLQKLQRHQDALNAFALASALDPKSRTARVGLSLAAFNVEWDVVRTRIGAELVAAI
jgi:tetratricopeptide (TPR) repeat protein